MNIDCLPMPDTRLMLLSLALGCLAGCATQVRTSGADGIAVQVGVTDANPARKAKGIADEHCARTGRKAVLQSVRDQVIFDYSCR
jgi:hypothetical protein